MTFCWMKISSYVKHWWFRGGGRRIGFLRDPFMEGIVTYGESRNSGTQTTNLPVVDGFFVGKQYAAARWWLKHVEPKRAG